MDHEESEEQREVESDQMDDEDYEDYEDDAAFESGITISVNDTSK